MFTYFFKGHILPLAIGHHSSNESGQSWNWFLQKMKDKFGDLKDKIILLDRDKGGRDAVRYLVFILSCIVHLLFASFM